MKDFLIKTSIFVGGLAIVAAVFVPQVKKKYALSEEPVDFKEVYSIKNENDTIVYMPELLKDEKTIGNLKRADITGIKTNDGLPLDWVRENLNSRFYYNPDEKILLYALPDNIERYEPSANGDLIIGEGGKPYISEKLIESHTDVEINSYDVGGFTLTQVIKGGLSIRKAKLNQDEDIRLKNGIKSPVMTELKQGDEVNILKKSDEWSKVEHDGYIGFLRTKCLNDIEDSTIKTNYTAPEYTNISLDGKITMGWHQVTSADQNSNLSNVLKSASGVNVIAPTWFGLSDSEGNFNNLGTKDYVDLAHSLGVQVWAVIDNFGHDYSANADTKVVLSSTEKRTVLINNLIQAALNLGIDGINVDFEELDNSINDNFIEFIRELSIQCRANHLILSIDNYVPLSINKYADRKEQGIVADYVILMAYDEHYAGGDAGSVSSSKYVNTGIEQTLQYVPKEKLICALPMFTRVWTTQSDGSVVSKALSIPESKQWLKKNKVDTTFNSELGQNYGETTNDKGFQQVWMEDKDSLKLKMISIKDHDLAGVAVWKLGMQDKDSWSSISWK